MCGIWFSIGGAIGSNPSAWVNALKGRGPEGTRVIGSIGGMSIMGFTRLAINGLNEEGMQPMESAEDGIRWICNGEIYNWRELATEYGIETKSGSDCEVLGPLYKRFKELGLGPAAFFRALDGVFAIVLVDSKDGKVVIGRDPYGVRPLYKGECARSPARIYASEMKAMTPLCSTVKPFAPGHYEILCAGSGQRMEFARYHSVPTGVIGEAGDPAPAFVAVRETLTAAVRKRMLMERPVAALLSGGLDSSLIAALVQAELRAAGQPPLKTFSIGMAGSTDLHHARLVADHIGSDHTEIVLTADDFFAAVPAVIRDIESYDTTTVRASVGNWLVSKAIRERTDCKVVFNGDGSDEVWGSYLYFTKAPSSHAYEEEVTRLLGDIHLFDVLRSDRSISSHGLEPRTPFLDKTFVAVARSVPVEWRRPGIGGRPEKWLLRKAFEAEEGAPGLLPEAVLWRKKEAFSDGVSSMEKSWYEICQEKAAALVPADWAERAEREFWGHLTPKTAEQYYYRSLFEGVYGRGVAAVNVPYFWMPRWVQGATDPSARTLGAVYSDGVVQQ